MRPNPTGEGSAIRGSRKSKNGDLLHKCPVIQAKFLLRALKIENDRYRITTKRGDDGETITQTTARTKALNALVQQIKHFRDEQESLMPRLHATLTAEERHPDRSNALTIKLWLPSDLPKDDDGASSALRALEVRMRWAAMSDELDNLLHQLRLRGCLNRFKILNVKGQRANTRARTAQDAVDANVKAAANAYRRHRSAYFALVGAGDWEKTMRTLADTDCRGLGDRLIEQMEGMSVYAAREFVAQRKGKTSSGETKYELPWIWYRKGDDEDEDGLKITNELMLEWLKSRARARNWVEEVWMVDEEMSRVLRFNASMVRIWEDRCYGILLDGTWDGKAPTDASGDDTVADGKLKSDETVQSVAALDATGESFARWAANLRATIAVDTQGTWDADHAWADGVRAYALKQASIRRVQAEVWARRFKVPREEGELFKRNHGLDGLCTAPLVLVPTEEDQEELKKKKKNAKKLAKANSHPRRLL
ncbi:unnamed protein product [Peniophora sp. CBMAI 1063]|nr:unnamed protein product [Peniophora sp. CBMAI 1063]